MFQKKRDQRSLTVTISTSTFTASRFFFAKAVHSSYKISLTCPRLLSTEDMCFGLYVYTLTSFERGAHLEKRCVNATHFEEFFLRTT